MQIKNFDNNLINSLQPDSGEVNMSYSINPRFGIGISMSKLHDSMTWIRLPNPDRHILGKWSHGWFQLGLEMTDLSLIPDKKQRTFNHGAAITMCSLQYSKCPEASKSWEHLQILSILYSRGIYSVLSLFPGQRPVKPRSVLMQDAFYDSLKLGSMGHHGPLDLVRLWGEDKTGHWHRVRYTFDFQQM